MTSRRTLLIAATVFGGAWAFGPMVRNLLRPDFVFEPIAALPGFTQRVGGDISVAATPFSGIATSVDDTPNANPGIKGDLYAALHDAHDVGVTALAVFTDYNCPFCRTLNEDIQRLVGRDSSVSVTWHEWPRIAPSSEPAARAALAAKRQGAYLTFHRRLMRTRFQPNEAYLRELAAGVGIDAMRLIEDMRHPSVEAALDRASALAAILALPGTPAMVLGRRLVIGRVGEEELRALIRFEKQSPSTADFPAS
ncbi:MAG: DsbA family protein [Pseudomonadota bacterium]